ncbi:Nuclear protein localization protein 4, partial [Bienertia sinuspersici]
MRPCSTPLPLYNSSRSPSPPLPLYNNTLRTPSPCSSTVAALQQHAAPFPVQLYSSRRPPLPSCSSSRFLPRVVAADAEGKVEVWSGSIQPLDVWLIKGGFRFEVCFNRYYQPIRKGGAVLVKFVADIAKKAELCPIGVVQADIVELIRGKFIIPDGKIHNNVMLKHVGKHRQQWKFELKARYLNPTVRTRQQIENDNPGGIVRGTWLELVKYWYSGQSKEMEHGREPGGYEFFDRTHKTKDGVYPENTNTQELIDMAKSKIDVRVASSSSSKPRIEDNSNQKPVGYGFGVKRSDVMGVHALLRKKGIASEMNNDNNDLKVKFARHKKETANLIMRLSSSVSDLLTVVQSGHVSPETLAATNSALRTITAQ